MHLTRLWLFLKTREKISVIYFPMTVVYHDKTKLFLDTSLYFIINIEPFSMRDTSQQQKLCGLNDFDKNIKKK